LCRAAAKGAGGGPELLRLGQGVDLQSHGQAVVHEALDARQLARVDEPDVPAPPQRPGRQVPQPEALAVTSKEPL